MPQYMLDTDTVSYALRGRGGVAERIRGTRLSDLCISTITLAELRAGAEAKGSHRLHGLIDDFLLGVEVVPFDQAAAERYGGVAASLRRRGEPIGEFDTLLAAQALSLGMVFVTNNAKDFHRVPGLKTENWV